MDIPRLGFGTYGRTGSAGITAIEAALETGYRHLDTAQSYDTERAVGQAIRNSGLPRDDIFVTTKVRPENFASGRLIPSVERSLEALGLDAVDLTLIHWPSPREEVPLGTYLEQLAEAQARGLTRLIGVSNFTIALLEQAAEILGKGAIATNQVELNPLFRNEVLAEYCQANGILVTCYRPVAHGAADSEPVLTQIADAHGATVNQVALAWELAKGYAAIPTSSRSERVKANFAARELKLSDAEMQEIAQIPMRPRGINPATAPDWD
jgi:2,5-diketo-D-gluconate reductase B